MTKFNIKPELTPYKTVKKFNLNYFLVSSGKYKYTRQDDIQNSELAQNLFELPYIQTIFIAENFVAVEISQNSDWNIVENEIQNRILNHFENGGRAVTEKSKFYPVEVYTEMHEGPGTLKFVCSKKLVLQPYEFYFNKKYDSSPFAQELFKFDYVKRIVFDKNHLIITKGGSVEWNEVTLELREVIRTYLMQGKTVVSGEKLGE